MCIYLNSSFHTRHAADNNSYEYDKVRTHLQMKADIEILN